MNDYGRGGVLGAASALPATTGFGLLLSNNAHPIVVMGLFIVSFVSFVVLIGTISRFLINSQRIK